MIATPMSDGGPRVLVVPSSYLSARPVVGGGERYAREYARALARLTPTTLAFFDRVPRLEEVAGLRVRTFGLRTGYGGRLAPLTRASLREIRDYDVIHLMIFPTPLTDLLILLARLSRQTVVLTDVGGGSPCLSTYLQRVHPRLSVSRLANGLALLSEHSAAQFANWGQPKIVLGGGADLAPPGTPSAAAGEPYALFVGRLLPHKGVLELIESIDAETPLRIVGRPYDTSYLERLREAARGKRIRFILDADDDELRRQYLEARVVLQPSIPVRDGPADNSELLGLVALEGMSFGKPVVVTRAGSLPEIVRDGATGYVVPPHDPEALRERIGRLMRDEGLAVRLGEAGRCSVSQHHTWDRVAERGLTFYTELGAMGLSDVE
jgi:glycosyltransferase involved in cell wall biosynthesis